MDAWSKCKVGKPSNRNNFHDDCCPINDVCYIVDTQGSLHILGKKKIRSNKDYRYIPKNAIPTVCISPTSEYRIGTVKFYYDLNEILKDKTIYKYHSHKGSGKYIFQFLVTANEYDFDKYDPYSPKGPWWHDSQTGEHYYNRKKCHVWFMIDDNLKIDRSTKINVDKRDDDTETANADFIASCISQSVNIAPMTKWKFLLRKKPAPVMFGLQEIKDWLHEYELENGTIVYKNTIKNSAIASASIKEFCRLFVKKDERRMEDLIASFKDRKSFTQKLENVVFKHFKIDE